jgi:hypothetical protein
MQTFHKTTVVLAAALALAASSASGKEHDEVSRIAIVAP